MRIKTRPFDPAEYLDTEGAREEFIKAAAEPPPIPPARVAEIIARSRLLHPKPKDDADDGKPDQDQAQPR